MNTFQPCIIVTFDHFWHHAIKQFSLYLLFKNFTCTCLHCLLPTMRLWLSLFAVTDPQLQGGALGFLFLYFEGGFIIYIPQKYKKYIYIYIYTLIRAKRASSWKIIIIKINFRFYLYYKINIWIIWFLKYIEIYINQKRH